MIPLVDMHVHLLAGTDDGPRTADATLEMCRISFDQGVRMVAATRIRMNHARRNARCRPRATKQLVHGLQKSGIKITACPNPRSWRPHMVTSWRAKLLSVADRQQHMLVEMPHGLYVVCASCCNCASGHSPHPAHPERQPELLHDSD